MSNLIQTLYGDVESQLLEKLASTKLLACDVDGVFSDGRIYLGNQGEEFKAFNTLDGYGLKAIMKLGVQVAVITGRNSRIVEDRMTSLGVPHIIQGQEEKQSALQALQTELDITPFHTASVGDDMPDLGMFSQSGVKFSVANGHPLVKRHADYVTSTGGGFGAVREICDLILLARGKLELIHGSST